MSEWLTCKKCNIKHKLYLQNKDASESIPMDYCKDCMFEYKPVTEQIQLNNLTGDELVSEIQRKCLILAK